MPGELNLGTVYASVDLRLDRLEQKLGVASSKFGQFGNSLESRAKQIQQNVGKPLEDLGRTITVSLAAPLLALGTAAVRAATQMDSLKRGLTAISHSSEETERQLKRLREVAKLPGLGFREAIQGSINLQAAGYSAKQAERSLMAFGNALATVGKGKAQLDLVNLALTQLANRTSGFGQEIRQLQEHLPQIRQVMLRTFGTADSELIAKAGITGKQFVEAITIELEKLPKMTGGIQNSFENLSDQLWTSLGELGKSLLPSVTRATEGMTQALQRAADWWKSLSSGMQDNILKGAAAVIAFGGITFAIGKVVSMVTTAIEAFAALRTAMLATAAAGVGATGLGGLAARAGIGGLGMAAAGFAARGANPRFWAAGPGAVPAAALGSSASNILRPAPVRITPQGEADAFNRTIQAINTELQTRAITLQRRDKLLMDRAALIRDALKKGISLPEGTPGLPQGTDPGLDPFLEGLRKRILGVGNEAAQKKAEAEARKRAAAARRAMTQQYQRERLGMTLNEIMFGKQQDPEQFLKEMVGWQDQTRAKSFGENLQAAVQDMVDSTMRLLEMAQQEPEDVASVLRRAIVTVEKAGSDYALSLAGVAVDVSKGMQSLADSMMSSITGITKGDVQRAQGQSILESLNAQSQQIADIFGKAGGFQQGFKKSFDWVADFAANLSEEFSDSFSRGLERAFGKNPFGRAIARSLSKMLSTVLDNVFMSGIQTENGGGQGGDKGVNFGALLGKIGLGALLGGVGSLFGGLFAEGGTAPGRRWSIVGERGPEIIAPAQAMRVLPVGSVGGVTINMGGVTLANSMDVQRVSREIAWQVRRELRAEVGS